MTSWWRGLGAALLMGAGIGALGGCEFVASADRSKIPEPAGAGGAGEGGAGGLGGAGGAGGEGGAGGLGGMGGSGGMGGAGGMPVDCNDPGDCPPPSGPCVEATCNGGTCGTADLPAGTVTPVQVPGDCNESRCDGAGAIVQVSEDADVPDDQNPCTLEGCDQGTPTSVPAPPGGACGMSMVCDGNGACVGCITVADCPGQDTECQARTCVGNTCGFAYQMAGTPVSMQAAGDCQENQCDGAGGVVSAPSDADVPVDGSQCTDDLCSMGVPSNPPLASGEACNENGGLFCDGGGACVECVSVSTCPGQDTDCQTRTCMSNTCGFDYQMAGTPASMQTAGDCQQMQCDGAGGVVSAPSDADLPVDGNPCTNDVCTAGAPSNPNTALGTACGQGVCDGSGACVPAIVTGVDYPVIAHGGRLVITGAGFTGASSVTVGGTAQAFTVVSSTQITVASLADATPIGAQPVVVTRPAGSSAPFGVTVIRLQISEVESNTPGIDNLEFVELSTGVPGVSLAGYTLVFWNGTTDTSYFVIPLDVSANASGRLVLGNAAVAPAPAILFPSGALQNGEDAVSVHQAPASSFPNGVQVTAAGPIGLIDALVYDNGQADDQVLLDTLITSVVLSPARVQVDENIGGLSDTRSIQRCANGRRDGSRFGVAASPSPGAANMISACP